MLSNQKILTSEKNQITTQSQKYSEYFQVEKQQFFKLLTISIFIASFVGLLCFIIQDQKPELIIFIALMSIINFILIFLSHRLKSYLMHILALLYIFSVASISIIIKLGTDIPQFLFGFSTGILFSVMIQYCEPRAKIFFILSSPWIYMAFSNNYSSLFLDYIMYAITTCFLLGFFSYQYENKQKLIFQQSNRIKQQMEIIRHFTSDYLFAISYSEKLRQFNLEFTNSLFENTYPEDYKDLLRSFQVINEQGSQNQKKSTKFETLEEFLFDQCKRQQCFEINQYYNLKIKNNNKLNDKLLEVNISRTYIEQQIFVIAIKSNRADIHIEKYENRIFNLTESITSLSAESGTYLQLLYQSLNKVLNADCLNIQEICKIQQSNILYLLNRMKNYLIFYQKGKLQIISQSLECYKLKTFLKALLSYFQIKSSQRKKIFISQQSLNFDQDLVVRLNQKLLTQILVNVYHVILDISPIRSIIRLSVTQEYLLNNKKRNLNRQLSDINSVESSVENNHEIIQFKFSFSSDEQIENIEKLFCCSQIFEQNNNDAKLIITNSVNNIILKIIGPYNEIYAISYFDEDLDKYLNEVYFYIYTDQSKLDPSFTKQLQLEEQKFEFQ